MTNPTDDDPCLVALAPQPDGAYLLRFELRNRTDEDVTIDGYQPFLQFTMRAEADGVEVPVIQPMLDVPLQRSTRTIAARGSLTLDTPIRLVIGEGVTPSTHRFTWTIQRAPAGLQLTFKLELPAPYDGPCRATVAPTAGN